jgi:hypothetical protein
VTRVRLRPAYTGEQLADLYRTPHDHTRWRDHHLRVDTTIQVARWMLRPGASSVADLSCGNAAIATALNLPITYLGDFAPGYRYTGPIEDTIEALRVDTGSVEHPAVDLFICSETIEHLDNPDEVLSQIRPVADRIVVSTPIGEDNDGNPEHYWGWDTDDVQSMLVDAGWVPEVLVKIQMFEFPYDYQVWGCR